MPHYQLFTSSDAYAEVSPKQQEERQQQDAAQHRIACSELTPKQQLLSQQENEEQHQLARAELSPQELELRQQANAKQMRNARAIQESNNDNAPILNNSGEAFSIRMESLPDLHQLVGWENDAIKSLMMWYENVLPPVQI